MFSLRNIQTVSATPAETPRTSPRLGAFTRVAIATEMTAIPANAAVQRTERAG